MAAATANVVRVALFIVSSTFLFARLRKIACRNVKSRRSERHAALIVVNACDVTEVFNDRFSRYG
jgi:hypothetical protein